LSKRGHPGDKTADFPKFPSQGHKKAEFARISAIWTKFIEIVLLSRLFLGRLSIYNGNELKRKECDWTVDTVPERSRQQHTIEARVREASLSCRAR